VKQANYSQMLLQGCVRKSCPRFSPLLYYLWDGPLGDLLLHLQSLNGNSASDPLLFELLEARALFPGSVADSVFILLFLPVLHSTVRRVRQRYPALSREDTAQQALGALLDYLASARLAARDTYLAFAIARKARRSTLNYAPSVSIVDDYIALMQRRTEIIRDIMTFLDSCPVLVLPISLGAPIPIDADQNGDRAVHDMLDAYRPLTAVSLLGLPSLAVPCGVIDGLPRGVQIVSGRYHEETCLGVGEIIARYQPAIEPIDPLRA